MSVMKNTYRVCVKDPKCDARSWNVSSVVVMILVGIGVGIGIGAFVPYIGDHIRGGFHVLETAPGWFSAGYWVSIFGLLVWCVGWRVERMWLLGRMIQMVRDVEGRVHSVGANAQKEAADKEDPKSADVGVVRIEIQIEN